MAKQEPKQVAFVDAVRSAASNGWGRKFASKSDAERAVMDDKQFAGYAVLELVRRVNLICSALAMDGKEPWECNQREDMEKPSNAKAFPKAKVGDFLFQSGGLYEETVGRFVVVAVCDGGFLRVSKCDESNYAYEPVRWATSSYYETLAEAIAGGAKQDLDYHGRVAEFAKAALTAVESGGELQRFSEGLWDDDGDDEADDDDED